MNKFVIFSGLFFLCISLNAQTVVGSSQKVYLDLISDGFPSIELSTPDESEHQEGFILSRDSVVVFKGQVSSDKSLGGFAINGTPVELNAQGAFEKEMNLSLGENKFVLIALDNKLNKSEKQVFVYRTKKDKRVALVIGNGEYQNAAPLHNPINDANSMSEVLKGLGFEVIYKKNLGYGSMSKAIRDFSYEIEDADIVFVYYSGHGVQINGENYLIPVDAELRRRISIPSETIKISTLIDILEYDNKQKLNIMVLDACRLNPFKTWARGGEEGLARIVPPAGTLIAYSTSPNAVAYDGDGENSLYTRELVNQLKKKQRIVDIFTNTRVRVKELSKGDQIPTEEHKLEGAFYLK